MRILWCVLLLLFANCSAFKRVVYNFGNDPIDVVIPCVGKDVETLNLCIQGIRQYGEKIRRIIVISDKKYTDEAEWFNEANYPFTKYDVALAIFHGDEKAARNFVGHPHSRIGWIYQQLLKLYASFVIPGISSNVLILDADTIFLNPVVFINRMGAGLYNPGTEYEAPYFNHMKKLLPGLCRLFPQYSGISHHMIFQRPVLEDLFSLIRTHHNQEPWYAFCSCIDNTDLFAPCSEYEIYFNFVFARTHQVQMRHLKWTNANRLRDRYAYKEDGYHFASFHAFRREG